ncbi:MAG: TfoX/Sxy family protein [Oscillibacter sp.]|nr:TfoX/Sxy family protein [Oscillibacter sp.]
MSSGREYLTLILEQLSELRGISYRPMMGEFLLYCRGKLFGGIYDNRLLVKPARAAVEYLRTVSYEAPYPGAKEMLLVDDVDDKAYLTGLVEAMLPELPEPKRKSGGNL